MPAQGRFDVSIDSLAFLSLYVYSPCMEGTLAIAEPEQAVAPPKKKRVHKRTRPIPWFSPEDGASEQLMDMRHVMNNDPVWDKTQGQKRRRILLDKSPLQFEKFLAELEKAFAE